MRRGEIDQQEAAEARKAMERKQAIVEEGYVFDFLFFNSLALML